MLSVTVGAAVGEAVGEAVGAAVGEAVGEAVGAAGAGVAAASAGLEEALTLLEFGAGLEEALTLLEFGAGLEEALTLLEFGAGPEDPEALTLLEFKFGAGPEEALTLLEFGAGVEGGLVELTLLLPVLLLMYRLSMNRLKLELAGAVYVRVTLPQSACSASASRCHRRVPVAAASAPPPPTSLVGACSRHATRVARAAALRAQRGRGEAMNDRLMQRRSRHDYEVVKNKSAHNSREMTAESSGLTMMTYNVHSGIGADGVYDLERIATVIEDSGADIVAIQEIEVNASPQRTRLWSVEHSTDQVREIAEAAGFEHHCFGAATRCHVTGWFRESHGEGSGLFGNAIMSRYRIVSTKELLYQPYGRKSPRSAIAALVDIPAVGLVWVVCTVYASVESQQALAPLALPAVPEWGAFLGSFLGSFGCFFGPFLGHVCTADCAKINLALGLQFVANMPLLAGTQEIGRRGLFCHYH